MKLSRVFSLSDSPGFHLKPQEEFVFTVGLLCPVLPLVWGSFLKDFFSMKIPSFFSSSFFCIEYVE